MAGYLKTLLPLGTFKYDRCMSDNKRVIPDEAVEAAARAMAPAVWGPSVWQFAAHGETPTDARDRVQQESLQVARAALEAAAPHILQSAAHDLAGADKTSHWDDRYREFEERDGGDLSSDSSAYLDGIGDAMRFLQERATK